LRGGGGSDFGRGWGGGGKSKGTNNVVESAMGRRSQMVGGPPKDPRIKT